MRKGINMIKLCKRMMIAGIAAVMTVTAASAVSAADGNISTYNYTVGTEPGFRLSELISRTGLPFSIQDVTAVDFADAGQSDTMLIDELGSGDYFFTMLRDYDCVDMAISTKDGQTSSLRQVLLQMPDLLVPCGAPYFVSFLRLADSNSDFAICISYF